jgi:hypothetical protein
VSALKKNDANRMLRLGIGVVCWGIPWPAKIAVNQRFYGLVIFGFMVGWWHCKSGRQ